MRRLMIEASAELADMLRLKQEDPAQYESFIRDYRRRYCQRPTANLDTEHGVSAYSGGGFPPP
jgi:hypothetical protein